MLLSLSLLALGVLATNCSELHRDDRIITELKRLEARMAETQTQRNKEMQRMEARMAEAEIKRNEEFHKIEARMEGLHEEIEHLVSTQIGTDVSFSAYAETGWQYPDVGEVITFPVVMSNSGGHYNQTQSIFTCPLNGTYYFVFSLWSYFLSDYEYTTALIQVGGEQLSEVWCHNIGPDNLYTQCGNSVVARCVKEQQVYITTRLSNGQLDGANKRTTFSGFLLHADIPPY